MCINKHLPVAVPLHVMFTGVLHILRAFQLTLTLDIWVILCISASINHAGSKKVTLIRRNLNLNPIFKRIDCLGLVKLDWRFFCETNFYPAFPICVPVKNTELIQMLSRIY